MVGGTESSGALKKEGKKIFTPFYSPLLAAVTVENRLEYLIVVIEHKTL